MSDNPLERAALCNGSLTLSERGRRVADVERYVMAFKAFPARPLDFRRKDTHDKGYLLDDRLGPAYAEIVLARVLRRAGWRAVWIDSYQGVHFWDGMPYESEETDLPEPQRRLHEKIRRANKSRRGGCWDVWAWRGHRNVFVEAKMGHHDSIRANQVRWFQAATGRVGLPRSSFCVAE